mmetsp:Transcript_126348/g.352084  ORF Transcript_126348/g.352084 Transcript_126348/m.352084 type:complete len:629 (-) Transcript_126348:115-2001(-)
MPCLQPPCFGDGSCSPHCLHRHLPPDLERRYQQGRRRRALRSLLLITVAQALDVVYWYTMLGPYSGVHPVDLAVNLAGLILSVLSTFMLFLMPRLWGIADALMTVSLAFLTASSTIPGQAWERLLLGEVSDCGCWEFSAQVSSVTTMFLCVPGLIVELDVHYLLVFLLWNVAVTVVVQLSVATECGGTAHLAFEVAFQIATSILVVDFVRRSANNSREMLFVQSQLAERVEEQRQEAQQEGVAASARVAAASAAGELAALKSFTKAVFDVSGQLEWHSNGGVEEPRLCFADGAANLRLEDLLGEPAVGAPLDALLGQPPGPADPDRERWEEDRQRLWEYAVQEAPPPPSEADAQEDDAPPGRPKPAARALARKIGLNRRRTGGQPPLKLDLFVQPGGEPGRAFFGLLVAEPDDGGSSNSRAPVEQIPSFVRHLWAQEGRGRALRAPSRSSSRSSSTSRSGRSNSPSRPLPMLATEECQGDVLAWVDIVHPNLLLLQATIPFLINVGPLQEGAQLIEVLEEPGFKDFSKWLFERLNWLNKHTTDPIKVTIRSRDKKLLSTGMCQVDTARAAALAAGLPVSEGKERIPVLLQFTFISQKSFQKRRRHGKTNNGLDKRGSLKPEPVQKESL